ncbi:MAG: O-antigen ligase family protein, partial [Pseudomonadota bacterium]
VALALALDGLTRRDATLDAARHDGTRLALALVVLCAAAAGAAAAADTLERRWSPPRGVRRAWGAALVACAALVVVAAAVRIGSPVRVYDAFTAPLPAAGADLGGRLSSASGNGRADYWRVAAHEVRAEPLLGGGAGSYGRWWLLQRPTAFAARDAHNLYLEVLAELGPVGLALLLAALSPPLVALVRAREAAAAGAAYVAFLLHAAVDWDWEIPAVTGTALLAGAAILAAARTAPERALAPRARALALAALVPVAVAAGVAHAGNRATGAAEDALGRDDPEAALTAARRARRFAPWSTDARRLEAEAHLAAGRNAEARTLLREAVARDRGSWELWYDLALASTGGARGAAADEARALNPRSPELQALPRSRGTAQDR